MKGPIFKFNSSYGSFTRNGNRGVAKGGPGVPVTPPPPLVGLLLSKQPTIFRCRKRHDNILAVKATVEKPTSLKFVFL